MPSSKSALGGSVHQLLKGVGDASELVRAVRARGLAGGLRYGAKVLRGRYLHRTDRRFDRTFGVDTQGVVELDELTVEGDAASGEGYEPTHVVLFARMAALLPADLKDYVFVDVGAGKGRVVLLASSYPFKKIIGVEFARELYTIMQENARRYRNPAQRCSNIQLLCMDIADFSLPEDRLVIYLYNPLMSKFVEDFIEKIRLSYVSCPRKIIVLFYNPRREKNVRECFDRAGIFTARQHRDGVFNLLSPYNLSMFETDA